jgi:putative DNA primase/helicase
MELLKEGARRLAQPAINLGFRPEALHEWVDPQGKPIFWRIRAKHPQSGDKWIRPMRRNGRGYELGEPEFPEGANGRPIKPLYKLDVLARRRVEPVWWCEGENKVDALGKLGVVATTAGSAQSDETADLGPLAGRTVIIWPDNDEPGVDHGNRVAGRLRALACKVEMIDVHRLGLPQHGDAVDWLKAHPNATAIDLEKLPRVPDEVEARAGEAAEARRVRAAAQSLGADRSVEYGDARAAKSEKLRQEDAEHTRIQREPAQDRMKDEAAIERLAAMSDVEYDRVREAEADRLGVRVLTLDRQRNRARAASGESTQAGSSVQFNQVEPWPEPVEGAALLDEITAVIRRHAVLPPHTDIAIALWIVLTHVIDKVRVAPILVVCSPDRRCGKSTLLALLARLVARAITASNISAPALFRTVEKYRPTLLIDEADSFLRDNEELRGVLNSGHTRDTAYVVRCVGDESEPRRFCTWGSKAIALIGRLPGTLTDRSIVIEMQRKPPGQRVERLRHTPPALFDEIAAKLVRWSAYNAEAVGQALPDIPDELHDRAQDKWEGLLALADLAGGVWPDLARRAALALSGGAPDGDSLKVELLRDVQWIFADRDEDRISSEDLVEELAKDKERPWAEYRHSKQITQRQLAGLLVPFGIASSSVRLKDGRTPKGYRFEQFIDAFSRYLPLSDPPHRHNPALARVVADQQSATGTPVWRGIDPPQSSTGAGCGGVADIAPRLGHPGHDERPERADDTVDAAGGEPRCNAGDADPEADREAAEERAAMIAEGCGEAVSDGQDDPGEEGAL